MFGRKFYVTALASIVMLSLFGAPELITEDPPSNIYPITITDPDQKTIAIDLTEVVTWTTAGTWVFKIGTNTITGLLGPVGSGESQIRWRYNPGFTYSDFQDGITVEYVGGGDFTGATGVLAPFGPTNAVNNLIIDCSSWKLDFGLNTTTLESCSPAEVLVTPTYRLQTHYVNSLHYNPALITIRVYWGDGTSSEKYGAETSPGTGVFTWDFNHVYPDDPTDCSWEIRTRPGIFGVGYCSGGGLEQLTGVLNHTTDNRGNGIFQLNADTIPICIGQDFSEIFIDATEFNCNPLIEPDYPNDGERIVRFIYGTNYAAGSRIQDILIDGNSETLPYNGSIITYDSIKIDGTPDPGYAVSLPISHTANLGTDVVGQIFEITIENWNPCNPYDGGFGTPIRHQAYIKIVDGPMADAGSDFSICENADADLDGALLRTATIAQWSTNTGDGSFTNPTSAANAIYHHGAGDASAGGVWLVLTASDLTSGCPEHKDSVYVTIDPIPAKPTISIISGSNGFCDDDATSLTLESTVSPNGNYLWRRNGASTGVTTQTIMRNDYTQSGDYTVTVYGTTANVCPNESDPFTVNIYQMATTTNPTNETSCEGTNTTFNVNTGGGAHNRRWQVKVGAGPWTNLFNDATYSGTASQTLTITGTPLSLDGNQYRMRVTTTAGSCETYSNAATLTVIPAPTAYAGADASICENDNYHITDASVSNEQSFSWSIISGNGNISNPSIINPTYNPHSSDAGTTVTLRLTAVGNAPCANATDNIDIFVDAIPTATTNASQEICGDINTIATLQGNTGGTDLDFGATGLWTFPGIWIENFNDLADGTIVDNGATAWSRTIGSGGAGWYSEVRSQRYQTTRNRTTWTSETINIFGLTNVGISLDLSSYATGNGFEDPQDYYQVRYFIDGSPTTIYSGNGAVDGSTGGASTAFRTVNVTASGIIGTNLVIEIRTYNSATDEFYIYDNIIVTEGNAPVITDPTDPNSTVTNLPSGPTVFTWTVSSATGGCAPASSTHTVTRWDPPSAANAGADDDVCEDESTYTLVGNVPVTGTGLWSTTGGATITTPGSATTGVTNLDLGNNDFTWTISNGICPDETDEATIFRNSPVAPGTLSADQQICEGETPAALTGTAASGGDGATYTYEWQYSEVSNGGPWTPIPASNNTGYSPGALITTTWYRRIVSSGDVACLTQQNVPSTNVIEITVEPELFPGSISGDQSICLGEDPVAFVSDAAASGGNPPYSYQWYHKLDAGAWTPLAGEVNETYDAPNTLVVGTHFYYREVSSSTGYCSPVQTNELNIFVNPGPAVQVQAITGDASKCEDETITLNYAAVALATEYVWNFSWVGGFVDTTTAAPAITIDLSVYSFASPFEDVTINAAGVNGCNTDPTPGTGDYPWSADHDLRVYQNPVADAGADDDVCGSLDITLGATASAGTGTWTDLGTGPGSVSFDNANSPSAIATATLYGTYTLQWEEDNGGCVDNDGVTVTYYEQPTVTPPVDQDLCDVLSTTLTATGHSYQAGSTFSPIFLWEYVSGPDNTPTFGTANSVSTTVTVDYYGAYQFRITETNGTCSHSAVVQVVFSEDPSTAFAGTDIDAACDLQSTTLDGTAHAYLGGSNVDAGVRTWSYVSGPDATPTFTDSSDPDTQVSVDDFGNYVFRWTETNGACSVSDEVTVKFFEDPDNITGSGPYEAVCDAKDVNITVTAHVYAGAPVTHPESTRGWSYFSGPDATPTFSDPNSPTTNVAVDNYGTYTFRWTETNGPCSNFTDVDVTYSENPDGADAGSDLTSICDSKSVNLAGTAHTYEAPPSTHIGSIRTWSYVSGPDNTPSFTSPTSPTSEVVVDYYGTHVFEWTETNGNCTVTDQVTVDYYEDPVDASAGPDIVAACNSYTATLDGTGHTYDAAPNENTGSTRTWTWISGPDATPSFTDASDPKTVVQVDYYGTYVFEWTETNGNCSRSDQVTVTFSENPVDASAGSDITGACGSLTETLGGTAHVYDAPPNDNTGSSRTWAYVSGPDPAPVFTDPTDPTTDVTVTLYGVYQFSWTEINGNCTVSETITATFYEAPTVNVTPVPDVCLDSSLAVIPIEGTFGGGATSATWSITTGNGSLQNINTVGNTVTAEYVPTYDDITAGSITLTLTTDDPTGPCISVLSNLIIDIDESVYVVIDQAPLIFIAQGDNAVLTATISGAGGAVTTGTWTVLGPSFGGVFSPSPNSTNVTFTPTAAQQADGGVTLQLTSDDPVTSCGPAFDTIFIVIGANPIADAGEDQEDCEPADSLLYISGWAKAAANDANWSIVTGNGAIISQTKTWSVPQAPSPDETDSLLVEATYQLDPSDYGTPSGTSTFQFELTTDDPDGVGPVQPDVDQMDYIVSWSPQTPAISGGGLGNMCINSIGNFYSVPLTPGNDYNWKIEVLSGGGVPGVDYIVQAGGTGSNFIVIDWINLGTYNLKVVEIAFQTDGITPCPGDTITKSIAVYNPPVATAGPDTTICLGETVDLLSNVTDGSGDYSYEWTPAVGLSDPLIANPVATGLFVGPIGYNLEVTDNVSGCASGFANVTIMVDPLPAIYTLTGPSYYCDGATTGVTLVLSDSENDVDYTLYNGAVPVSTKSGDGDSIAWTNNFTGSYFVRGVRNAVPACEQDMAGIVNVVPNPPITVNVNSVVEPLCNGGSNGSISITPGGGTPPYTYLWSGPGAFNSTNEDISGLAAGDYTVEVTDSRGCTYTHTPITVGEPDALVILSIAETKAVTCFGGSDGEATVTVDPATGTAPYSYQWYYDASFSNPIAGAISNILSAMPAATYYVIITDVNGCTVNGSIAITQPTEITGSGSVTTPVSCNGEFDAIITVTAAGGSGMFEYDTNVADLWQAANTFTVGAGTYTLRVRDAASPVCIVALADVVVTEPDVLLASGSVTSNYNGADISCPAATDGIITVTGSGGTTPYEYNIDGGAYQAGNTFSGLGAGTYTMGIRDANGCTDTDPVTITAPTALGGTLAVTSNYNGFGVSCNGSSNGVVTVTPSGGTGSYTYVLVEIPGNTTGQFTGIFSGLPAGDYTVEITDQNGCTFITPQATVTEPAILSATVTPTQITCFGANDGIIDITAPAGGTGGYEYSINGGGSWQASGLFTNRTPQSYNVQIRDNVITGCVITLDPALVITQPAILNADIATTNVTCNGDDDGTITLSNPTGGYAGYEYSIDGSNWFAGPVYTFTNLAPATYAVFIRDDSQITCQVTLSTTTVITEPSVLTASGSVTSNYNGADISCPAATDGEITTTATGGTAPYEYNIDGGAYQAGNIFSGLGAGTYTMGIRDANGCTDTDPVTLADPTPISGTLAVTSDYNGFGVSCNGSTNGTLTVTPSGGTGSYTFVLVEIPGNLTGMFTGIFSGVPAGDYTVEISDLNGCTFITPQATVTEPTPLTAVNAVTSDYNGSDVSCFGASDGEITVTPGGGEGTYSFLLIQNPGNTTGNASGIYTGLSAGIYTVRLTDNNGCTVVSNADTIENPPAISASLAVTSNYNGSDISCPGASDGEVTATASGGTGALSYVLVEDPANVTGIATGIFTGLAAGNYSVRVTDQNGCFVVTTFVIVNDPLGISAFTTVSSNYNGSEISCNAGTDGEITVSAFGGTGALSYVLVEDPGNVTGAVTGVFSGLSSGSYTVTVTDANGCFVTTAPVSVDDPPAISANTTIISNYSGAHVSCFGASDGSIRTTATGGTGLLTYELIEDPLNTSGDASGIYTGLSSGSYTVRVTDQNGCNTVTVAVVLIDPAQVTASSAISSNYNGSHVSCNGAADGEITVTSAGGTGTLTYVLNEDITNTTGNLSGIYRNLAAGTYTVTVTDMNGCNVTTAGVTLVDPPIVTSSALERTPYNGQELSCFGASDGIVDVTGGGGTGALTYAVVEDPLNVSGAATGIFTGMSAGTYTFSVTDANGCSAVSAPVTIDNPPAITYTINVTSNYNGSEVSCPGASDGEITVVGSDGTGTLSYQLDQDPLNTSGDVSGIYTGLLAGTYTVTITDDNGCTVTTTSVTIDDPAPITATSSVTSNYNGSEVSCFGASDGSVRAIASGGTGALSHVLDQDPGNVSGVVSGEFTGLVAGIYTITVSDANGCNLTTAGDTIDNPPAITASAAVSSNYNGEHLSCFGSNDGEITVTANGGTGAYTHLLVELPTNITGRFSGVFAGLVAGDYTVTVTDANGCFITTAPVTVSDPAELTVIGSVTSDYNGSDVSCYGDSDGEITIIPTGGTGALLFELIQIPANITGSASGIFTGLPAGAYTVRVTDANGCNVTTDPIVVSNPPQLTATTQVTSDYNGSELSCRGDSDGEITVSALGGTGGYNYNLIEIPANTTGDASGIYTGLPSGGYTVRVVDNNLCEVITLAVTIDEPDTLVASAAVTSNYNGSEVSCFGASDGIITVTATGGTGILSYLLNEIPGNVSGAVTGVFTGLPSGSYTVTVTDLNGCFVVTTSVDINDPDEIIGSAAITSDYNGSHVSCSGANDATIEVTAIGGTVSLEYSSNGGLSWQASSVFDLLLANTYHIVVRDVNNCMLDLGNIDVLNPAQVVVDSVRVTSDYNGRDISCVTASDGEATVYAVGGTTNLTGNLNYEWFSDPAYTNPIGQTTATATGLSAGIYYVRVFDDNDCAAYGNVTVSAPPALFGSATVTSNHNGAQISCNGASDGEITIMAFGGTGAYEYSADGQTTWGGSNVIGSLPAGNHDVWIRDANLCEYNVGVITIVEPSAVTATASVTSNYFGQDVTCVGASDGIITVIASGGTGALQYSIDAGTTWQATPVFSGLSAGTYNIDVMDVNSCSTNVPGIVINDPPPLTGSAAVSSDYNGSHISCNGAFDGEITITLTSNGSGTVMYSNNGGLTYQAINVFSNLAAGDYDMSIRDINGCITDLGTVSVIAPSALVIDSVYVSSDFNGRDISCTGASDGEATIVAAGGTGTIYYEWFEDAGLNLPIGQTTVTATGLSAGTYYVRVYDDNNCLAYSNVTLNNPPALAATITINSIFTGGYNVSCNGASDGDITLTPSGGTSPYTFLWTGPSINAGNETMQNPPNLAAGTYDVTVTDANGCITTASETLMEPDILTVTATPSVTYNGFEVSCTGETDGGIILTVAGGSGAGTYTFLWTGPGITGSTDQNQSNLGEGLYSVDVTDGNGCTANTSITLTAPNDLVATATSPNDFNGFQVSCNGGSDGAINLNVVDGVPPYTYAWTGPAGFVSNSQNLIGLRAGTYDVTVTDNNGCTTTANITLTEPTALSASAIVPTEAVNFGYGVSCNGSSDADIDLTISGGIDAQPYIVSWDGPLGIIVQEDLFGVPAGLYTATITDDNGCITTEDVTVTEPAVLNPGQITGNQFRCYDGNPGLLNEAFGASGGPTARLYQWEISTVDPAGPFTPIVGATGPTYDPPANITQTSHYRRSVTSGSCGPEYSNVVTVTVNPLPVAVLSGDADICPGTSTDIFVEVTTGTPPFIINIDNGAGVINDYRSMDPLTATPFTAPVTYNLVSIIDSFGCQVTAPHANITGSATVNFLEEVSVDVQPVNQIVCEGNDASFSVTAQGEMPYSYQWYENNNPMPGEINATLNLLSVPAAMDGNFYYVEITGGCGKIVQSDFVTLTVQTNTVIIDQPSTTDICENLATSFEVNATGSITGYQWQEDNGVSGWQDLAESGTYVGTTTKKLSVFSVDSAMTGYQYRVNITGICTALTTSDPATLIVKIAPVIRTQPVDAATCETVATSFTVLADGDTLTYQWQENSGAGFVDIPEGGAYTGTQTATLTLTSPQVPTQNGNLYRVIVRGACTPPVTSNIALLTVNTFPAVIIHPDSKEICEDGNISFIAGATGTGITYHWQEDPGTGFVDISDGGIYSGANTQTLTLTTVPATNNGYRYRIQVRGSCATVSSSVADLIVNPNPGAIITGDGNFPVVCGGLPMNLDGNPTGGTGVYTKHEWTGDVFHLSSVNTQQTTFSSIAHGTYNYTYTVTDSKGCIAKADTTVENDRPDVRFSSDARPSCGTITVNFTNESNRATAYEWDMDDDLNPGIITDVNPSYDFSNTSPTQTVAYFNVELVGYSSYGCSDTARQVVTVYPSVDASFTIDPDEGCNPVIATMQTAPGGSGYYWDFGDDNAENGSYVIVHQFNNDGTDPVTYTVTLITTSFYGCTDQETAEITVHPIPEVYFSANPFIQQYPAATVNFDNLTQTGSWTFEWDFGDGDTSTEFSPSHTYDEPEDYIVTLKAITPLCSDSNTQTVSILPASPVAAFDPPTSGCAPLEIRFENNSQYGNQYLWDFGNGSVSYKESPTFTYFESGTFQVTLTVYGPGGTDTHTELVEVKQTPTAYTNVSPLLVFVNDVPVKCFNLSTDTVNATYLWDFGDETTSDTLEPAHVYTEPGRYDITLTVTNDNECTDVYVFSYVEVEPAGEMQFPTVFRPSQTGPADPHFRPGQDNNEIFFPGVYNQVLEYELVIYNRWGEQIFISTDVNIGWNGWIDDTRMAEQGVYIWRVRGKYANGQNFQDIGDITLLK